MTLIEKLQAAEKGSRELDAKIWCVVGDFRFKDVFECSNNVLYSEPPSRQEIVSRSGSLPDYTTSIDAALTLVPENWGYRIERGHSMMWSPDGGPISARTVIHGHAIDGIQDAVALCIAALEARHEQT